MPRWVLPAIILFLLILALAFRWEEGPEKTYDWGILTYKFDRWSQQNWCKVYISTPPKIREFTIPPGWEEDKDIATGIWAGLVIVTSAWLLFSIEKPTILSRIGWKNILLGIGSLFFLYVLIALCVTFKPEMLGTLIAFLVVSLYFTLKERGNRK